MRNNTMKKKHTNPAEVDSSFTVFFITTAFLLTWLLTSVFSGFESVSLIVVLLFVLLMYFIWDFIKQLYSPGQAVFLWALTFLVLPLIMSLFLSLYFARIGVIVFILANLISIPLELLYERVVKKRAPKKFMKRLTNIDGNLDKSIIKISDDHVQFSSVKGFSFAVVLILVYLGLSYLLLSGL